MTGAAPAASPAVDVDRLVKRYGERTALDGLSFRVEPGELFAILGPNGAGKTTTVEIIEGYRSADGGSVRVLGIDPARAGRDLRARVGLMLQGGGGVDPRATPRDVVGLYAALHASAEDPVALLARVGLEQAAGTRYRRLSGGERQRLALALALVGRPELLILDEPTAGMDPAARAEARSLLRELCDAGRTVILTTHDLGDVERVADRVAILVAGRVVALDSPGRIAASVAPIVRFRLSEPAVDLDGLVGRLAGTWPTADVHVDAVDGRTVRIGGVTPEPALLAAVAAWAVERDALVLEWRAGAPGLEEAYLVLTGGSGAATTR